MLHVWRSGLEIDVERMNQTSLSLGMQSTQMFDDQGLMLLNIPDNPSGTFCRNAPDVRVLLTCL
jgi:hypothetical protein